MKFLKCPSFFLAMLGCTATSSLALSISQNITFSASSTGGIVNQRAIYNWDIQEFDSGLGRLDSVTFEFTLTGRAGWTERNIFSEPITISIPFSVSSTVSDFGDTALASRVTVYPGTPTEVGPSQLLIHNEQFSHTLSGEIADPYAYFSSPDWRLTIRSASDRAVSYGGGLVAMEGNAKLTYNYSVPDASSRTNLVVNGSFEIPSLPLGANHVVPASQLLPWQTTESSFLIWASDLPNEKAAEGRQHAEVVSIWQTVQTVPGKDYRFRFQHSPRPNVDSTLAVQIGAHTRTFTENGSGLTAFDWRRFATNFTAIGSELTIRFTGTGVTGNAHIDDIVLEPLPLPSQVRVSEVEVCWPSVATRHYRVQYRSTVTENLWMDLLPPVPGNGDNQCIKDTVPTDAPQRFYRVIALDQP